MDHKECKKCFKKDIRVSGKARPDYGTYYINASGKKWNGHTCPACHEIITKVYMDNKRKLTSGNK